jgi:large subunit ribosomal protein L9
MKNMEGLSVILVRAASEMGQLFGSVSARDIAEAVGEVGHSIEKRQVVMDKAIKTLGLFPVRVNLHAEVQIEVIVNIARSAEEAKKQAETGAAVVTNYDAEEESVEAVADAAIAEVEAETADEAPAEAEASNSEEEAAS